MSAYDVFDCEFGFHSHEWSYSEMTMMSAASLALLRGLGPSFLLRHFAVLVRLQICLVLFPLRCCQLPVTNGMVRVRRDLKN